MLFDLTSKRLRSELSTHKTLMKDCNYSGDDKNSRETRIFDDDFILREKQTWEFQPQLNMRRWLWSSNRVLCLSLDSPSFMPTKTKCTL